MSKFLENQLARARKIIGWIGEFQVVRAILEWWGLWPAIAGLIGGLSTGTLSWVRDRPLDLVALVAIGGAAGGIWITNGILWFKDRRPRFTISINMIVSCTRANTPALVLGVTIGNTGQASTADDWQIFFKFVTGEIRGAKMKHLSAPCTFPIIGGNDTVTYDPAEAIYEKTKVDPVTRGGQVVGSLYGEFEDVLQRALDGGSEVTVTCRDAWGRKHSKTPRGIPSPTTSHYPGLDQ